MIRQRMILVAVILATIIVSGCGSGTDTTQPTPTPVAGNTFGTGGGTAASNEPVTITFGVPEFQRQTYEPLAQAFHEQNPTITVKIVSLDQLFGFGRGEQPKIEELVGKVVRAADTAIPLISVSADDIANIYLYDLKPLMDADTTFNPDDYYPNALEQQEDGGIYMLPYQLPVPVLSYNKEVWAASGLADPDPNWTWNDLVAAAEQIAKKRGDTVDVYGLIDDGSGLLALFYELNAVGVDLFSINPEELHLDTPQVQSALEHVAALQKSGALYIPVSESGVIQSDRSDAQQLILDQRVGIWSPTVLMGRRPNDTKPSFAVGTMPFPAGAGPNFFMGLPQGYIMSSGTQHPQEAWRWLSFISRQEIENQFGPRPSENIIQIPARKSLAEKSGYWTALDEQTAQAVRTTLERPQPRLPAGMRSDTIQTSFQAIQTALAKVIAGTSETVAALQDAQAEVEQRVAELQLTPQATAVAGPVVVDTPEPDETPPPDAVQITFGTLWFGAEDVRQLAKDFHQQNPGIVININNVGTARDMPEFGEIAESNDCFAWFNTPSEEDQTLLLDIRPLLDADTTFDQGDYPSAFFAPFTVGSAVYALPLAVDFLVLNYNQTAFDEAGLDYPNASWTLDDMVNAAQQLDSGEGTNRRYGFVSFSPATDAMYFLDRAGASYTQGSGDTLKPNFTDPKVIQALQRYIDLLHNSSPQEKLQGYRSGAEWDNEPIQLAFEGRVGMWLSMGGMFFGPSRGQSFTRAIAPPPLGDSEVTTNDFNVRGLYISASTQHPDACWSWLKYIGGSTSLLQNSFPARTSVAQSPDFSDRAEAGAMDVFNAYQENIARSSNVSQEQPDRSDFDPFWLFQAIDRALQGEDLERELTDAQQTTEQFLACVQAGTEASVCAPQVDPDYQGFNQPEEDSETN